jgi:flagellar hook protein FlgE
MFTIRRAWRHPSASILRRMLRRTPGTYLPALTQSRFRHRLRSGALEESNVDLTAELVNMMTAQRTYQANAQTIKTQDQVMSTLVNLR